MSRWERLQDFLAELARPSVLWFGGASASWATIVCAQAASLEGAAVVTAAWAGIGGVYWAKSHEAAKIETARVETAKAPATPAPGTATLTAAPDVDATLTVRDTSAPDDGELPLDQRVNPK